MSVLYTTTAAEFGDFDISPSATNIVNMVLTDSPPLRAQRVPSPGLMAEPITIRHTQQQQQQGHTLSPVASRLPPAAADDDVFDLPPPPDMQAGDEPLTDLERSNLYVSNVSTDVDDDEFRVLFSVFGVILNSRIMVDIHTCKSRGFGFVQFSNPSEAAKAVRAMDGTVHRSQTLMVRLASRKTRQPGQLTAKMFVRNVPAGISEDEVRRYCSRFGAVQNCAVRPDMQHGVVTDTNTGGVSQVAYITFVEVDATKKAALSLNNTKPWPSCVHPLLAKVLDSNQKRRTKEEEAIHTSGGSAFGQPGSANSSATNPRTGPTLMESPGFDDSRNSTHGAAPSMPLLSPSAVPPPVMLAGSAIPSHNTPTYLQQQPAYAPPPTFLAPQHTMLPPAPAQQMAAPTGYQIVMQPTLQPIYGTSSPHNAYMSQASMQPPQLYQSPPGMLPSPHSLGMGTPTAMVGTPQGLISTPQGLMSTHTQQPQPHWAQPQQVYVMSPPPNGAAGANMVLAPRTVVRHNPFSTM